MFKEKSIKINNSLTFKWDWLLLTENVVENVENNMIEEWIIFKEIKYKNLKELSLIMIELMKLKINTLNLNLIILQQPEKWLKNISILEFLAVIKTSSLNNLRIVCLHFFTLFYIH